jgi:hypothetical protein
VTKRAMFWVIAAAIMGFFFLAGVGAGGYYCSGFGNLDRWFRSTCETYLPSRLALLLIGLIPAAVLVYFAEKDLVGSTRRDIQILDSNRQPVGWGSRSGLSPSNELIVKVYSQQVYAQAAYAHDEYGSPIQPVVFRLTGGGSFGFKQG